MKVDDLILDLQNLVDNARPVPLSGGKVMVNSDEAFEIIAQIQDAMPAEVRQAKNIVADRKQILNEANSEAENIIRATTPRLSPPKSARLPTSMPTVSSSAPRRAFQPSSPISKRHARHLQIPRKSNISDTFIRSDEIVRPLFFG